MALMKKIVLIMALALSEGACLAEETHVAEIIASVFESVAKLKAEGGEEGDVNDLVKDV